MWVEHVDDYLPAVKEALAADVMTLIDVVTDPDAYPPITVFGSKLEEHRAEHDTATV